MLAATILALPMIRTDGTVPPRWCRRAFCDLSRLVQTLISPNIRLGVCASYAASGILAALQRSQRQSASLAGSGYALACTSMGWREYAWSYFYGWH